MALAKKRKATLAGDEARSALPQRRVHRPLMDSKAFDLALADMPGGNRLTLHVLAAAAEHERDAISARTKAALAAAKANGKKLGNYRRIAEAKQRATTARAEAVRPAVTATAHLSTRAAADALNRRGIKTASGAQWHAMQVHRVRQPLGL
jgi:DNA invertase Pin-like site-specific DNA recombinase